MSVNIPDELANALKQGLQNTPENRTANNSEKTAEMLETLIAKTDKESRNQTRRFWAQLIVSLIAAAAAVIAAMPGMP